MNLKLVEKTLNKLKGRALAKYWIKISKNKGPDFSVWYNSLSPKLHVKIFSSFKGNIDLVKPPKSRDAGIIIVPAKVKKELTKLLDYCEDDEARHYEETSAEERKGHIYNTIKYLRKALNG